MLRNRTELRDFLRGVLGSAYSNNVYFQPPENIKLSYPCIIYKLDDYPIVKADNKSYLIHKKYSIELIMKLPDEDEEYYKKILNKETAAFDRVFINDNLYHYVFTITI